MDLEETLATHLELTPQTWERLRAHGVTEDTELQLDFAYHAPNRAAAEQLKAVLDEYEYAVEIGRVGPPLRRKWLVEGQTCPTTLSLQILTDWVTWMVHAGAQSSCEFDGWGAVLPGPPPSG